MRLIKFLQYFHRIVTPDDPHIRFKVSGAVCDILSVEYDAGNRVWTVNLRRRDTEQ